MTEKIVVPLDGSKVGEAALDVVKNVITKFSPDIKVEITLLQVLTSLPHYIASGGTGVQVFYTPDELDQIKKAAADYLMKAGEPLAKLNASINIKVATGNAADEILKTAEEIDADLIAMSTHGRSGISRWVLGSVADHVLRSGNRPILVVRASKQ
jgi:nucleotide-binding universal stress UspA family protein